MNVLVKRIDESEMLPPWYGCAWHDWRANQMVCLPIGLNLAASFIRVCYFMLKHGGKWMRYDPRAAFNEGMKYGIEIERNGASHER